MDPLGAPVVAVGLARDPALDLEPVQQTAKRRLLDVEQIGELRLGDAIVEVQIVQHPPLRAGEAQRLGAPVVGHPHQARDIVHQKAEIVIRARLLHGRQQ